MFNQIDRYYYNVFYNIYQNLNLDYLNQYIGSFITFLFTTRSGGMFEFLPVIMTVAVGFIGIVTALYVHIMGIQNTVKKHFMNLLSENGNILLIIIYLMVILLFGGNSKYLIGATCYLIYLVINTVTLVIKFDNNQYYESEIQDILNRYGKKVQKSSRENEIKALYQQAKLELNSSILKQDLYSCNIQFLYLKGIIENFGKDIFYLEEGKKEVDHRDNIQTREDYKYIKNLYKIVRKNKIPSEELFYLHYIIAKSFYKKDRKRFRTMLYLSVDNYKYYLESKNKTFLEAAITPLVDFLEKIYDDYQENFESGKIWVYEVYNIITAMIEIGIEENDKKGLEELMQAVKNHIVYEKNYQNKNSEYFLLEASIYFQLLIYLDIKKINTELIKKDELKIIIINFMRKEIQKVYQYMEFFNFITDNFLVENLDWKRYIKKEFNIVGVTPLDDERRLKDVINQIFLELISEISKFELQDYSELSMYNNELLKKIEETFVGDMKELENTKGLNEKIESFFKILEERNPNIKNEQKVYIIEEMIDKN